MAVRSARAVVAALALVGVALTSPNSVLATAKKTTLLTREEAEILIYLIPEAHAERDRGRDVSWTLGPNSENFYDFWVVANGKPGLGLGSETVGYYAVNKHTGDIWATASMRRVTSPELQGAQKIIRAAHHIDDGVLKKYSGLRPSP
jgi:hypothetical protein